jgi:hypothetical protein
MEMVDMVEIDSEGHRGCLGSLIEGMDVSIARRRLSITQLRRNARLHPIAELQRSLK